MGDSDIEYGSTYKERCARIRDAVAFRAPDKVPYISNVWSWRFMDAGYTLYDGTHDYEVLRKSNQHFFNTYHVDGVMYNGLRNPMRFTDAIGSTSYQFVTPNKMVFNDAPLMDASDYNEAINNFAALLWGKIAPQKCNKLKGMQPDEFIDIANEFNLLASVAERENKAFITDGEMPVILSSTGNTFMVGYESVFNFLRGIKGTSIDLRRQPENVAALCSVLDEMAVSPKLQSLLATEGTLPDVAFDTSSIQIGHTILSRSQYEQLYWPTLKKIIDTCAETGKTIFLFIEGTWLRFADLLADYPKGTIAILVEQDDIHEVREKIPNACLVGGLDTTTMGKGTTDECIAMAKRVVDEFGGKEGGLILSENKMISYENDMKSDNLKAVVESLEDYR